MLYRGESADFLVRNICIAVPVVLSAEWLQPDWSEPSAEHWRREPLRTPPNLIYVVDCVVFVLCCLGWQVGKLQRFPGEVMPKMNRN